VTTPAIPITEGYVVVPGGRVWVCQVGAGGSIPLLTLHGGPGFPHPYLEPLAALAGERPVIFYDQLGCGESDQPSDPALWRLERFVEELRQVRRALGLGRVHLYGHSWGGMLAVDYALGQPDGLASLVLASPILSVQRWLADMARLRADLPAEVRATLERHEAAGTLNAGEYQAATMDFYLRHYCRLVPWPAEMLRSLEGMGLASYRTMWGPNDFIVTGNLAGYERVDRLPDLRLPVLLTAGRHDEATPAAAAAFQRALSDAELVIFEHSAHVPHLEEEEAYLRTLRAFLRRIDGVAR
jgi:proline-specific peptidase